MKCSYAAFGEQNKTDNNSKCQLVYKSQKLNQKFLSRFARTIASQYDKNYLFAPKIVVYYRKLFKITGNNGNFENKAFSYTQQS